MGILLAVVVTFTVLFLLYLFVIYKKITHKYYKLLNEFKEVNEKRRFL